MTSEVFTGIIPYSSPCPLLPRLFQDHCICPNFSIRPDQLSTTADLARTPLHSALIPMFHTFINPTLSRIRCAACSVQTPRNALLDVEHSEG